MLCLNVGEENCPRVPQFFGSMHRFLLVAFHVKSKWPLKTLSKTFIWGCQQPCLEKGKPEQIPALNSSGRKLHQPTARNDVTEELGSFCCRLQRTHGCPNGLQVLGQWEVLPQPLCEGHQWLLPNRRRKSSLELTDLQGMVIPEC